MSPPLPSGFIAPAQLVPVEPDPRRVLLPSADIAITAYAPTFDVAAAGGNPFGAFYRGFGQSGGVGWQTATPPAGTQAGDYLICQNSGSSCGPTWTRTTFPSLGPSVFTKTADGDSSDEIASSFSGIIRTIFGFRDNASFELGGVSTNAAQRFISVTDAIYPASTIGILDRSFILVWIWKSSLDNALSIAATAPFEKTGERIFSNYVAATGIVFQTTPSVIPQGSFDYAVEKSTDCFSGVVRQDIVAL